MSYLYPEGKGQKSTPNTGDINRFNFIDRTKIKILQQKYCIGNRIIKIWMIFLNESTMIYWIN